MFDELTPCDTNTTFAHSLAISNSSDLTNISASKDKNSNLVTSISSVLTNTSAMEGKKSRTDKDSKVKVKEKK